MSSQPNTFAQSGSGRLGINSSSLVSIQSIIEESHREYWRHSEFDFRYFIIIKFWSIKFREMGGSGQQFQFGKFEFCFR